MKIKHNYACGKEEAYKKVDNLLTALQEKYGNMIENPTKQWNSSKEKMDFSFIVKGFDIQGNIALGNDKLILEGKLPFLANLFSGKIETAIKSELEKLFN